MRNEWEPKARETAEKFPVSLLLGGGGGIESVDSIRSMGFTSLRQKDKKRGRRRRKRRRRNMCLSERFDTLDVSKATADTEVFPSPLVYKKKTTQPHRFIAKLNYSRCGG